MARAAATDHDYKIELWDDAELTVLERLATASNYWLAKASFDEAVRRYPGRPITIRQGIRVVQRAGGNAA